MGKLFLLSYCLPFFHEVRTYANSDAYLELSQTPAMELFYENS